MLGTFFLFTELFSQCPVFCLVLFPVLLKRDCGTGGTSTSPPEPEPPATDQHKILSFSSFVLVSLPCNVNTWGNGELYFPMSYCERYFLNLFY
jgi:hypothetical protein